jgi:hypothetical protein
MPRHCLQGIFVPCWAIGATLQSLFLRRYIERKKVRETVGGKRSSPASPADFYTRSHSPDLNRLDTHKRGIPSFDHAYRAVCRRIPDHHRLVTGPSHPPSTWLEATCIRTACPWGFTSGSEVGRTKKWRRELGRFWCASQQNSRRGR